MLFNSPVFILIFLPIVTLGYFLLARVNRVIATVFLISGSLFFYSYWNPQYLPLILASVVINYSFGYLLGKYRKSGEKTRSQTVLAAGILFNILLLLYFKYTNFAVETANTLFGLSFENPGIELPLAISFFTFQQIAYLVDSYRGETHEYNFLNYTLFVTFFPQLIAGPIVHHKEMMPQFSRFKNKFIQSENFALGLFIFAIGLFKKVMIADTLSPFVAKTFGAAHNLNIIEAWLGSLAYTFQIYFDFSGYTDMAIGIALFFNIRLPFNFNSPYKALSIQDFWRRWHITLSRFLKEYVYIPLGGNRKGESLTLLNLFLTFLIGGIWHGAGFTFIIWGALHGIAIGIHRLWQKTKINLPRFLAGAMTFFFVHITWVFFRAENLEQAFNVLRGMFGLNYTVNLDLINNWFHRQTNWSVQPETLIFVSLFSVLVFFFPNIHQVTNLTPYRGRLSFKMNTGYAILTALLIMIALMSMFTSRVSEFIYFNF